MVNSSQESVVNGSVTSKVASPSAQANRNLFTSQSALAYTGMVTMGQAPFGTLLQQPGSTASSIATRDTKVQREVNDALTKLNQAPTK